MRYLYLFTFIIFIGNVQGAYFNSVQSGNWNDPATWGTSGYPSQGDNVTIKAGHIVILNIDLMNSGSQNGIKSLYVETGASLTSTTDGNLLFGSNSTMTIYGTVTLHCFRLKNGATANIYGSFTVTSCSEIENNAQLGVTGYTSFGGSLSNSGSITGSGSLQIDTLANVTGSGAIFGIQSGIIPPGATLTNFTWRSTATNTNWFHPSNWSGGSVPNNTSIVTIMAGTNQPVINTSLIVNKLIFNIGATLSMGSSGSLTISDSLILKAASKLTIGANASLTTMGNTRMDGIQCIHILSNATGTGSFIDNGISGSGTAKIQRHATASKWHFVSSPILNALSGVYINQYLKPFDETINNWGNYIVPTNIPLPSGTGYALWPVATTAFEFIGTPGSGAVETAITYTDSAKGYNLVGNPFPSALDWNAATGFNTTNLTDWIIIWNQQFNNYGAYQRSTGSSTNGVTRYIPVGQGFFVLANGPSPTLSMNRNARVHNFTQPFLKETSSDDFKYLKLSFKGLEGADEVILNFLEGGSSRFDVNEDCRKWYGNATAPQAYTMAEEEQVSVNTLPSPDEEGYVIPVYLETGLNGDYSMRWDGVSTLPSDYDIYLEDVITHAYTDIRTKEEYVFYSSSDDPELRFRVHIILKALGTNDLSEGKPYSVHVNGHNIIVNMINENLMPADITVYDISGRTISSVAGSAEKRIEITAAGSAGVCLVKIRDSEGNIYTEKVFIR